MRQNRAVYGVRTRIALAAALLAPAVHLAGSSRIGKTLPPLVVRTLAGERIDAAGIRGRVLILSYCATWCAPCREEMPVLEALYEKFHERGLEILGLSLDRRRARDAVAAAARFVRYPIALLDDAETDRIGRPGALPVTWVIDRDGVVRAILEPKPGPVTLEALEKVVGSLLAPAAP